jgi:hypothetical protein
VTGPSRTPPGDFDFDPGEDAQSSETAGEPLAWQRELDVAIDDIDSRLKHPRRRATDVQPTLPQLGQPEITTEIIDEIAWRVAEMLRHTGTPPVPPAAVAAAISQTVAATPRPRVERRAAPPPPPPPAPKALPRGIAISIRVRKPFFRLPWPFRRRHRKQAMITFSDYRIT